VEGYDSNGSRYWVGQARNGGNSGNNILHIGHRDSDTLTIAHYGDDADFSYTADSNQHLHAGTFYNSSSDYYIDGQSQGNGYHPNNPLTGNNRFKIGGANTKYTKYWLGTISEVIFYTSDEAGIRSAIEDNINGYYNIY
jgi:hypothetical protein